MNKTELVEAIAASTALSKANAAKALDAFIATVTEQLSQEQQVTIVGFGTFLVRSRESRSGRNPRTGEEITIPAQKVPAFKPGKNIKDAVNKKEEKKEEKKVAKTSKKK